MKVTAVIMAGGRGERFWPKSRNTMPKQFLSLTKDGETMLQKTVKRLLPLVDAQDVFIVTNAAYVGLVKEQLPFIPAGNILAEPCARNTAPCIALAAAVIGKKYDDAVMLVLPSDHLIGHEEVYLHTLKKAVSAAETGSNLVTVGIFPEYPETGYGYINFTAEKNDVDAFRVAKFVEKPDLNTAEEYIASGRYLWNSGMFAWKISTINSNLKEFMPEIYEGAQRIKAAVGTDSFNEVIKREFEGFKSESIDFGIMEKAKNIYTIPGSFGWDDVGSWLSVARINELDSSKNYIEGNVISVGTGNCVINGGKRLIAAVGLDNLIIVDTEDALLICSKDKTQDVKKVIELLKEQGHDKLI